MTDLIVGGALTAVGGVYLFAYALCRAAARADRMAERWRSE